MTLNLCVLTPNQIVWDSEVKEIILSTNKWTNWNIIKSCAYCHNCRYRYFKNTP